MAGPAESGKARPGPKLPVDIVTLGGFSADGKKLTLIGAAADRTTDIYLVDVASGTITRATESRHDGVDLASLVRPELIEYTAGDGLKLSGWLYRPKGVASPMPLVFSYHGGPEGQMRPAFNPVFQYFLQAGYAVLAPNVRGSTGYGTAYMNLDNTVKRMDSVKDLAHAAYWLRDAKQGDPKRLIHAFTWPPPGELRLAVPPKVVVHQGGKNRLGVKAEAILG